MTLIKHKIPETPVYLPSSSRKSEVKNLKLLLVRHGAYSNVMRHFQNSHLYCMMTKEWEITNSDFKLKLLKSRTQTLGRRNFSRSHNTLLMMRENMEI